MNHKTYKVKVFTNGDKEWYLNGNQLTEAEFNKKTKKPCNNKVVECYTDLRGSIRYHVVNIEGD